jgi:putative addiction module component (TIGR02574 family)
MTQETQNLLQKALALTENERAESARTLISSLETVVDQDVDAAWQQEIIRRADDLRLGKAVTIPWEEVKKKGSTLLHSK